ncbi:MAG: DUF1501 domain-containing protein, partial [Planctomycetaceae bacterium]|nr:DUF1501 domain-containing protein [Planctomycetaceae bacterium]
MRNHCTSDCPPPVSRREMLEQCGLGFGSIALTGLMLEEGLLQTATAASSAVTPGGPGTHFPATARSVIFLFLGGGPSQVDTFDPKPLLGELHGQDVPPSIARAIPRIARSPLENLLASPWRFRRYGESGIPVSE